MKKLYIHQLDKLKRFMLKYKRMREKNEEEDWRNPSLAAALCPLTCSSTSLAAALGPLALPYRLS